MSGLSLHLQLSSGSGALSLFGSHGSSPMSLFAASENSGPGTDSMFGSTSQGPLFGTTSQEPTFGGKSQSLFSSSQGVSGGQSLFSSSQGVSGGQSLFSSSQGVSGGQSLFSSSQGVSGGGLFPPSDSDDRTMGQGVHSATVQTTGTGASGVKTVDSTTTSQSTDYQLTEEEVEAFKAEKFVLGHVPEHAPPEVYC